MIKQVLDSHLSPKMISYFEYQEDFLKNAFEANVNQQITSLMHFYFLAQEISEKMNGPVEDSADKGGESGAADEQPKDVNADEKKDEEGEQENGVDQKKVLESQFDFVSLQIHKILVTYPTPKLTPQMEKTVADAPENLFKFKLMDINEKLIKMSTLEFDKICLGRIEK